MECKAMLLRPCAPIKSASSSLVGGGGGFYQLLISINLFQKWEALRPLNWVFGVRFLQGIMSVLFTSDDGTVFLGVGGTTPTTTSSGTKTPSSIPVRGGGVLISFRCVLLLMKKLVFMNDHKIIILCHKKTLTLLKHNSQSSHLRSMI